MNQHSNSATVADLAGNVQEEAGEFVGSQAQDMKDIHKQMMGRAEQRYGDAKTIAEDAKDTIRNGAHRH